MVRRPRAVWGTTYPFGVDAEDNFYLSCFVSCFRADCAKECQILDGAYSSNAKGVRAVLSGDLPTEVREALAELARQLQAGKITPEKAQEEAEKITPKAKGLFNIGGMADGPRAAILAAIITIGGGVIGAGINTYGDIRSAQIQAKATIEAANISAKASLLNSTSRRAAIQTPPTPRLKPEAPRKKDPKAPR